MILMGFNRTSFCFLYRISDGLWPGEQGLPLEHGLSGWTAFRGNGASQVGTASSVNFFFFVNPLPNQPLQMRVAGHFAKARLRMP